MPAGEARAPGRVSGRRRAGRGLAKPRFNAVLSHVPPPTVITTNTVTRVFPCSSRKPITARVTSVSIPPLPRAVTSRPNSSSQRGPQDWPEPLVYAWPGAQPGQTSACPLQDLIGKIRKRPDGYCHQQQGEQDQRLVAAEAQEMVPAVP